VCFCVDVVLWGLKEDAAVSEDGAVWEDAAVSVDEAVPEGDESQGEGGVS